MNNYYSQAERNQTNKVWDKFNQQEKTDVGTTTNISEINDAKKRNIGITVNDTKNIEDKYYGENSITFDNDSKYFHPSNGGKTANEDWLPFILTAAAIVIIPPFFM